MNSGSGRRSLPNMPHSACDDTAAPTLFGLMVALLLAEVAFGLVFWLGWIFTLLSLIVTGAAVTACIAAMLAIEIERAAVQLVTGRTPARLRLAMTGWPVIVVVLAVHARVGWESWNLFVTGIAAGLIGQAVALHYLWRGPEGSVRCL